MFAAPFDYIAPTTLDEALRQLTDHADEAKILAGGHSLIPAMKLRLAQPQLLIDIGRIKDLAYIREEAGHIRIGATPAIVNAVVDALSPFGVRHLDMPIKPETVWRIIKSRES